MTLQVREGGREGGRETGKPFERDRPTEIALLALSPPKFLM